MGTSRQACSHFLCLVICLQSYLQQQAGSCTSRSRTTYHNLAADSYLPLGHHQQQCSSICPGPGSTMVPTLVTCDYMLAAAPTSSSSKSHPSPHLLAVSWTHCLVGTLSASRPLPCTDSPMPVRPGTVIVHSDMPCLHQHPCLCLEAYLHVLERYWTTSAKAWWPTPQPGLAHCLQHKEQYLGTEHFNSTHASHIAWNIRNFTWVMSTTTTSTPCTLPATGKIPLRVT